MEIEWVNWIDQQIWLLIKKNDLFKLLPIVKRDEWIYGLFKKAEIDK
jgi:hypothetical protein